MTITVGERFTIALTSEPYVLNGPDGRHIATFLPGYGYRVTGKNLEAVTLLVGQGRAVMGVPIKAAAGTPAADAGKIKGSAKTGKK